jgi:hypothetical protein
MGTFWTRDRRVKLGSFHVALGTLMTTAILSPFLFILECRTGIL